LDNEREAGVAHGQGTFTVALEKARLKLQKYLLGSREEWIKKLIQSVSGWRVSNLQVKQTKDHTVFHFQPSLRFGLPSGSDILQTFLEAKIEGRLPLNRFCQALHSIRELESLSFYLAINDGKRTPVVYHDGPHASEHPPKRDPQAIFSALPGITLGLSHRTDEEKKSRLPWLRTSKAGKRLMADLACALSQAALVAPVPIVLDAKRLDRLELGPYQTVLAVRGLDLIQRGDRPIVLPRYLFHHLDDDANSGEDRVFSGYMLLKVAEEPWSVFNFVDDGAVIERLYLPSAPSLSYDVFVNCQGLPTSLNGLELVPSDKYRNRLTGALERVREYLLEFHQRSRSLEGKAAGYLSRERLDTELGELVAKPLFVREART
jgi:hypothetical protein